MKKAILLFIVGVVLLVSAYSNAATLKWDASTGTVTGYNVYYGTSGAGEFPNYKDVGAVTEVDDIVSTFNLVPGETYDFMVRAYNTAGESGDSNIATYETPLYGPPDDNILPQVIIIPGPVTITVGQ